jgi:carboxypeptidase Taq
MATEPRFEELLRRLGEVEDLRKARQLLHWDHETMMPPAGADTRAEQLGTLARIGHERFISDGLGSLLDELGAYEDSLPYDGDEASLIRVARRDYERDRRVPAELRAALARAGSQGIQAWQRAREANDYELFRPALERNLELQRQYIACFDGAGNSYDVLVEEHEPGLTTADIEAVFDPLKAELVPLVSRLEPPGDAPLALELAPERRRAVIGEVLGALGFDPSWGRIDHSVHPFAASLGSGDVRLTTYDADGLRALYAALHEFGHGLYERGVGAALERTLLGEGGSSALHESQSLLWENLVGRSRPFSGWLAGVLGVDPEELHRTVNRIERSLIRVDADPVTYSLHVIFRFELERELVTGALSPADLRDAWNERVADYLHCDGLMGYFPSYALGQVASVQIWERLRRDLPDLDDGIGRGEFGPLVDWLRTRIHAHGRKFTPRELLERVVGTSLDPRPLLGHLRAKVAEAG